MALMHVLKIGGSVLSAFKQDVKAGVLVHQRANQIIAAGVRFLRENPAQLRFIRRYDVDVFEELGVEPLVLTTHVKHNFAVVSASIFCCQGVYLLRYLTLQHQNVRGGNSLLPSIVEVDEVLLLVRSANYDD